MDDLTVFNESEVDYINVDWGLTKVLVGKNGKGFSDKVMVKITEYLPGYIHKPHVHEEQDEIIITISGKGISTSKHSQKYFGVGDVVVIPAGLQHETYNPFEEPLKAIIVKSPPDSK
jgi:mannose-6-phosphate isomerase-like protein (cupin superfamily)